MRIGLVGAGGMGAVHHASYQYIDGAEVAAVVGFSEKDRQRAGGWGLPFYESVTSMLKRERIDLVDVCTPSFLHRAHVGEALSEGKPVICEKPLALTEADARELFALASRNGAQLYVAQVLQFYKESAVLRELVASKEYGEPLDAVFTRLSACPRWMKDSWLFDKEKSGFVPFDLHLHDLDLILSLFGEPTAQSFVSCGNQNKSYQELYRFTYSFPGLSVSAEAGWLHADIPFMSGWRVYFENALVQNENGKVTAYANGLPPRVFDTEDELKIPTGINVSPTGTYLRELRHFLRCAEEGRPSELVPQERILSVLRLLERMFPRSAGM